MKRKPKRKRINIRSLLRRERREKDPRQLTIRVYDNLINENTQTFMIDPSVEWISIEINDARMSVDLPPAKK